MVIDPSLTEKRDIMELVEGMPGCVCLPLDLIINGKLLLENSCAADVFSAGQEIIEKIRKRVKNSESQNQKFLQVASTENSMSLDNQAQWITTYEMPVAASG
ncbi:hypothetical protein Peur_031255 [Populus x canadensis]